VRSLESVVANAPRYVLRSCVIGLVVGVLAAAAIASKGDTTYHAAWIAMVFMCTPILVGVTLAVGAAGSTENRLARMRAALVVLAAGLSCFLVVQVPGCAASSWMNSVHVDQAKVWCERLAEDLDRWRDEHGAYPESLETTSLVVDPPVRCRSSLRYSIRDGVFTLEFMGGEEFFSAWCFRSDDRTWRFDS
jgi:hypothetical protein